MKMSDRRIAEFKLLNDPGSIQALDLPLSTIIFGLVAASEAADIQLVASISISETKTERRYFLAVRAGASLSLSLSTYIGSYVKDLFPVHLFEVRQI